MNPSEVATGVEHRVLCGPVGPDKLSVTIPIGR